jgi:hypothetical protein
MKPSDLFFFATQKASALAMAATILEIVSFVCGLCWMTAIADNAGQIMYAFFYPKVRPSDSVAKG